MNDESVTCSSSSAFIVVPHSSLRRFSNACSHVGIPRRILYCDKRSNTSGAEREPRAIRIIVLHHLLSHADGQAIFSLFRPGNLRNLQCSVRRLVEDGAAEEHGQRHFAIFETGEIFRGGDVEVERARHGKLDDSASLKGRHDHTRVRPQRRAQGLPQRSGSP